MSILLLGNGINLQEGLASDWKALLQKIAKGFQSASEESLSMTLGYEMLENRILQQESDTSEISIRRAIADLVETDAMKKKKDWSNTVHARFTAFPVRSVLTTNYDYAIERSLDPMFKKSFTTRETTYSLQRYQKAGDKTVYHIHGECGYPRSICLGFEQYAGSLQRIRDQIVRNTAIDKGARDAGHTFLLADIVNGLTSRPEHSWIYDFFLDNVYILGLKLDVSEMDLWWLLSYRSKLITTNKLSIHNKIVYLDVDLDNSKDKEMIKRRRRLLEAFHVKYISCKGEDYTLKYEFAYNWLKNNLE